MTLIQHLQTRTYNTCSQHSHAITFSFSLHYVMWSVAIWIPVISFPTVAERLISGAVGQNVPKKRKSGMDGKKR